MAEIKTINTRIVLRNDSVEKWNISNKALLKGEAALALRSDGNYEIRFGANDSLSTWSMLSSTGQLIIPAKNVEFLTYQEYQLSSLATVEGEQSKFQLWGKRSDTAAWEAIGNAITVPEVDFGPVNAKIEYLSGAVDKLSTDLSGEIDALSTSLSNTVDAKIKNITDNYALSADVTSISSGLYTKIVSDAAAAQAAGELSAQAVRHTYELCAVKYEDVKGGKAAITTSNKLVTQEDIAALTGVMHFVGTTTDTNLSDGYQGAPTGINKYKAKIEGGEGKNPEQGDFVIRTDNAKEFIYVGTWNTGKWNEIGDEDLYAKKSELDAVESKVDTHIADTDVHVTTTDKANWNAKATSADVSSIADAYCSYEQTRAIGIESALRTDVNTISGQVSSFSNAWKSSVDLSVSNLSSYSNGLSTDLASEIARAKATEEAIQNSLSDYALSTDVTAIKTALENKDVYLSTAIDNKVKIGTGIFAKGDTTATYSMTSSDLSVVKIAIEDYYRLIDAGKQDNNAIYIISSDYINGHDKRVTNVGTALSDTDAVNLSGMTNAIDAAKAEIVANTLSGVTLNGALFEVANNVATLDISCINCGTADN